MKYKIIVDKQSRVNPSGEQKEYVIDIEELRVKGDVCDLLVVTPDRAYVERKLQLSKYNVLTELEKPIIEELGDLNIELFEKENYIYLIDMEGNKFYAEYVIKNDFTDTFVTSIEMNTAISQTTEDIMLSVNKKVDGEEFGTYIQQNAEAIKIAWNQITDFIQLMVLNNNASLAILDKDKKVLMALDKEGQHFYKDGKDVFGQMGVQKINDERFISFSVEGEYNKQIENGMAWGIKTKSDGEFYPILSIRNFAMGPKNSDGGYGELELSSCNLVLNGFGTGIKTGGVLIHGDPGEQEGVFFWDISKNKNLLTVSPDNFNNYANIAILDNINFYKNQTGSNTFRIGNDNSSCILTDTGYFSVQGEGAMFGLNNKRTDFDVYPSVYAGIHGDLNVTGKLYADNYSSDRRIKKNIKNTTLKAIDLIKQIKHKQFDMKEDSKHYRVGYIAQEMEEIDSNFVLKREKTEETEERYYINELPIIATATKAIQEQQEQIEILQETNKQKDETIKKILERLEIVEKEVFNGKD